MTDFYIDDDRRRKNQWGGTDKLSSRFILKSNKSGKWELVSWEYLQ